MWIIKNIYVQIIKLLQKEKNINVNILKMMLYDVYFFAEKRMKKVWLE